MLSSRCSLRIACRGYTPGFPRETVMMRQHNDSAGHRYGSSKDVSESLRCKGLCRGKARRDSTAARPTRETERTDLGYLPRRSNSCESQILAMGTQLPGRSSLTAVTEQSRQGAWRVRRELLAETQLVAPILNILVPHTGQVSTRWPAVRGPPVPEHSIGRRVMPHLPAHHGGRGGQQHAAQKWDTPPPPVCPPCRA